ncbi:HEAT repeat-containing protein 4 isoform X1 [Podarcis raffonei]|uniref:HEAT repeat-containing protein 4 isoform X1 n=1 Tax=Podarcis raffonei TaxID=65483 RepID=UPI002329970A|nr:HEAT repeat-containing protein 4 isoform X1 [Podarcis raffonei]XP_053240061.1 HEAT repeat-containing protein 4 isoform X1 [Podarcis raffonei]XP_053240070.1 HEAT repeat-containing protein 4 isoform X1 [Podarcis raffonei]XP_053240079.1 HEAT repeat-containing protein 4 isoform X1 [Podarcis raffonei]XP_053240085.1 HEAT repeat-containing protein 4 isoform X1 [Podarcis raffonei]
MEIPTFFKSKNPFPLESSLKARVDRHSLPSRKAMLSAMRAKMPFMYQRDVCHAEEHYAEYQKQCLQNAAKNLYFSKEAVYHRGAILQSFKDYDPRGLYDFSSVIQRKESENVVVKKQRRPSRLKPLKKLESLEMKPDTPPPKETTADVPVCMEELIWKAKVESTLSEPSLLVPIPPPPPPPSCEPPYTPAFLTEPHEMLGDLTIKRSKARPQGTAVHEPDHGDLRWEGTMLMKLNKATAQFIVNNQPTWGGWVQGKPPGFKKQKYNWESIRYVLPDESDVELLDQIQAEDTVVKGQIQIQIDEEKKPETPLSAYYYRGPSFHMRGRGVEDSVDINKTADEISKKDLRHQARTKLRERLSARVGKYSYTTQNVFEQELYFGSAKIVHQKTKRDLIVMDNHYEYYKQLQQCYPRPPEVWSFMPPKKTVHRVQKGAIHWAALPSVIEHFTKVSEAESLEPAKRERRYLYGKTDLDVSEEICIRKTMLEQWKAAWKYGPRWHSATIEGLIRDLADVHIQNRVNAILTCATAVLERPHEVHDASDESVIGIETGAKNLEVEDIPKKIQPLLRNTLFDKDAHVRMASAVGFYAMGEWNPVARSIMKDALINGNSTDSWTAAQALAMEGNISFHVVKRILTQIFEQKDDATEDQACLLLSRLSRQTGLVHCLLASELNSYQWKHRVLACKTFSRIPGSVSQDLKNKIVQLMWTDWKFDVRQAAAKALGHLELGKEVHDQLREKLKRGDVRMRVEALSLIGWLKFMTARLLPGFLKCFTDDFVAVRKEACWAAGELQIKEEMVLRCLFKIMQTDPLWKIKTLAIKALGQIGEASPYLKELLLWALHYEEDPGVRREACRSLITLKMKDETVRATLLERMIMEPNEMVKEEVSRAVKIFNFEQEEEHETIQMIKNKVATLSQKDLVIEKVLKIKEITKNTWQEAHRIYREKGDVFAYSSIRDIFLDVVQDIFTESFQCPSRKFSEVWTAILNILPWLGIPPTPWTQRAFLEALKIRNAEKAECAKKPKAPTEKRKKSRVKKTKTKTPAQSPFTSQPLS